MFQVELSTQEQLKRLLEQLKLKSMPITTLFSTLMKHRSLQQTNI